MARQLKNILVNRIIDKSLKENAGRYLSGRLLDIGCGNKPYEKLLAPHITEHVGLDHRDSQHDQSNVDLFGQATNIPADSDSFDSVLCASVLEHLEEPEQALRESFRILKKGGKAVYYIPFIWHIHEPPRDFYRYTHFGIRHLFKKAGFTLINIKALSGFWVTFGQLLVYNLYRFNRRPLRWLKIIDLLALCVQGVAFLLDRIDRAEDWTWMYAVVAEKQ